MFVFDFKFGKLLDSVLDWAYTQAIGFLANFFSVIANMGADLFNISWVQMVILFFRYLAWALYLTGIVVTVFELAIEYQTGRGNIKGTALNVLKGFFAVSLFTSVPIELYKFCISLQSVFTKEITGYGSIDGIAKEFTDKSGGFADLTSNIISPSFMLFAVIMVIYAVVKVFFANLKRGGILLIQIAVGSLHMFSIPRGYLDGFTMWCKQIIGLCLSAFLQAAMLTAGLLVMQEHLLLGLGLMLSAAEIPRIAGQFGLDTSTKTNAMSAVYTAQAAVNTTRTVVQMVSK